MLPRPVFRHRRVRRRSRGPDPDPRCRGSDRVGLCVLRTPGFEEGAARPRAAHRAPPSRSVSRLPAGTSDLGARLVRHGPALLGGRGRRTQPGAPASGATVIDATTDGGGHLEGAAGGGWQHPSAERRVLPDRNRVHGGRLQRVLAPGRRRRRRDQRRRRHVVAAMSPQNALVVSSVTCASPIDCTAIVSDGMSTWSAHSTDFGQSWQQEGDLPASLHPGERPHVHAGETCLDAGYVPTSNGHGQGAIAMSGDGGQTWAAGHRSGGDGRAAEHRLPQPRRSASPAARPAPRSATWSRPRASCCAAPTVATRGCRRAARSRSTTCTAWTARSDRSAPWWGPLVRAPAVGAGWRRREHRRRAHLPEFADVVRRRSPLTAVACPSTASCIAVGGDTVAQFTLLHPRRPARTQPKPARPRSSKKSLVTEPKRP